MKNENNQIDNYKIKLIQALISGQISNQPGTVNLIQVLHDDWCGIFRGKSCNCSPVIKVKPGQKIEGKGHINHKR
jgi:hypothetical protein